MRKKNQEITDIPILEEILRNSIICRIAMHDQEYPYLLPFNYGYKDRTLYIHSAPEGKKIELLKRNNLVAFEVTDHSEIISGEEPCDWSTRYRSVAGIGEVEILTTHEQKQEGLEVIMNHHGATGPYLFDNNNMDRMVILKLSIREMTGKRSGNWNRIL